ncbi:peptidyl-arginine deiminase, partial [Campylobacter fetus subsp. testudinum]
NGALIVPTYGDKKSDELALSTLKEVLSLDVIGVDSTVFIRQNGSLHCSSQNRFKGKR